MPFPIVERPSSDTSPLFFSWAVADAAITARVSVAGAPLVDASGVVTFARTEGSSLIYQLSYSQADRPTSGYARYELSDGSRTEFLTLYVDDCCTDASEPTEAPSNALAAAMASPKAAVVDGVSMTAHGLLELIAADRYLAAKRAASSPSRGLRFSRLVPGGTTAY